MKGIVEVPANIIGYVILLAIFIAGLVIIASFWFNFQTIPVETPESSTACDLAYVLSTWKEATVSPNIFDKSFLDSWDTGVTEEKIFEDGASKFFLPGYDYFVKIKGEGEKEYVLYIPSEGEIVFETCGRSVIVPDSLKELEKLKLENFVDEFEEKKVEKEYAKRATTYNELSGVCALPVFIADESDPNNKKIEVGNMVAGLTSNIATKIREGIYSLSVSYDPNDKVRIFDLGSYPEGCTFDKGITKTDKKVNSEEEAKSWWGQAWDFLKGVVNSIWDALWNLFSGGSGHPKIPEIKQSCGFEWDWNYDDNKFVITVDSLKSGRCTLSTRIPKSIVEEAKLIDENGNPSTICEPRKVSIDVWNPEGSETLSKVPGISEGLKHFFLKVEKLDYNPLDNSQAIEFCKTRCKTEGSPWCLFTSCEDQCNRGFDIFKQKCSRLLTGGRVCQFAKRQLFLYKHLPKGAIDIKYIVVNEDELKNKVSLGTLKKEDFDFYDYRSACSSWPGIFECTNSEVCSDPEVCIVDEVEETENGETVYNIKADCDSCLNNRGSYCSPRYFETLDKVNLVTDLIFTCQSVSNYSSPLAGNSYVQCLPDINIKILDENGNKVDVDDIGQIDCSLAENTNREITWIIDASEICCVRDEDSDGICDKVNDLCPKMKFWSNLDTSNSFYLSKNLYNNQINGENKMFYGEITQKVCRGNEKYNNADEAFLVMSYYVGDKEFTYTPTNLRIEITKS
jgi:hypothetical protein